jgi:hypothetical protein
MGLAKVATAGPIGLGRGKELIRAACSGTAIGYERGTARLELGIAGNPDPDIVVPLRCAEAEALGGA